MAKKYVLWSKPAHPRGAASFKEFVGSNYGWITCSDPLYGSETENKYVSSLECEDSKATDLSTIITTLSQFNAKEVSPKLAVMYARKYNPAYIDTMTQIQYGYPYIDTDGVTIKRDTTHVDYSQAMQDDDTSENAKLILASTDIGIIRVVEDLVSVLIIKGTITLTDLPSASQTKINNRNIERGKIK